MEGATVLLPSVLDEFLGWKTKAAMHSFMSPRQSKEWSEGDKANLGNIFISDAGSRDPLRRHEIEDISDCCRVLFHNT